MNFGCRWAIINFRDNRHSIIYSQVSSSTTDRGRGREGEWEGVSDVSVTAPPDSLLMHKSYEPFSYAYAHGGKKTTIS